MKEPCCGTCKAGLISCDGDDWYLSKTPLTCCWITSTAAQLLPHQGTLRSSGSHQRQHKNLLRRGRGYKNLGYLLLKAQRMAATKTEFIVFQKAAKMQASMNSCAEPISKPSGNSSTSLAAPPNRYTCAAWKNLNRSLYPITRKSGLALYLRKRMAILPHQKSRART
jgi:hypothetical protein